MTTDPYQPGEIDREPHISRITNALDVDVYPGMRVLVVDPRHGQMAKWFAVRQAVVDVVCETSQRAAGIIDELGDSIPVFRLCPSSFMAGCPPQFYDLVVIVDWPLQRGKVDLLSQSRKILRWDGQLVVISPAVNEADRLCLAVNWSRECSYSQGLFFTYRCFCWVKQPGWLLSSYPRVGTHMLVTALDQHPSLSCLGEVFNPHHPAGTHGIKGSRQVLEACWSSPHSGFAMHCYIGRRGGVPGMEPPRKLFSDIWEHLPPTAKAVCVRRHNLLARYVSHVKANQTKIWFAQHGRQPVRKAVTVSPDKLLQDIKFVQQCWQQQDEHFTERRVVYYEDLINNWEDTCLAIQAFLDVAPRALAPTTAKLGRPLRADIENFEELQAAVAGKVPAEWFKE